MIEVGERFCRCRDSDDWKATIMLLKATIMLLQ